jgi:hypothetical protein
MAALPQIRCNGYTFNPRAPILPTAYIIDRIKNTSACSLSSCKNTIHFWGTVYTEHKNPVVLSSKFSTAEDIKEMENSQYYMVLSQLGLFISTCVTFYLFGPRKNFKLGSVSLLSQLFFSATAYYFHRHCRRANFNYANKFISSHQNATKLVYNPSDYKV